MKQYKEYIWNEGLECSFQMFVTLKVNKWQICIKQGAI